MLSEKKYLFVLRLVLTTLTFTDIFPPKQPLTPENTLIAFDLHHVLFRPNYSEMAKHVLSSPSKKDLLGLFCSPSFVLKYDENVYVITTLAMSSLVESFLSTSLKLSLSLLQLSLSLRTVVNTLALCDFVNLLIYLLSYGCVVCAVSVDFRLKLHLRFLRNY